MAKFKKICWTDADVKCPFYICDDRQQRTISCEGFAESTDTVSKFRTLALKERHMGIYCVERFENCPVYQCTYGCKYEEAK